MPSRGGARPGSGPKKGKRQQATIDRENALESSRRAALGQLTEEDKAKLKPLDVMLFAMQHELRMGNIATAAMHAKDAAPYLHCRLAQLDTTVSGDVRIFVETGVPRAVPSA